MSVVTSPETSVGAPSPANRLSRTRSLMIFVLPMVFALSMYSGGVWLWSRTAKELPESAPYHAAAYVQMPPTKADGSQLYLQHCAYCHGPKGNGNGTALLSPKARHFGFEKYKFASTTNGIPTDDDLLSILKRGIPGSAMPAFQHLPEQDLRALVDHVRYLTRRGTFDRMAQKVIDEGDDPDYADISKRVDAAIVVGDPVKLPAEITAATPEAIQHGKLIFSTTGGCAACHGPTGKGDGPQAAELKNEDKKTPNRPRDLTAGVFKGGDDPKSLYKRIVLGIPGTPMPAAPNTLTPKDLNDLIHYVRSLSAEASTTTTTASATR